MGTENANDFYWAGLALPDSQAHFSLTEPLPGSARRATLGWHGTVVDDERGAFMLAQEGGPLESLVGERVRVSYRGRHCICYCMGIADVVDEGSLARRAFAALAPLNYDNILAVLEVMG